MRQLAQSTRMILGFPRGKFMISSSLGQYDLGYRPNRVSPVRVKQRHLLSGGAAVGMNRAGAPHRQLGSGSRSIRHQLHHFRALVGWSSDRGGATSQGVLVRLLVPGSGAWTVTSRELPANRGHRTLGAAPICGAGVAYAAPHMCPVACDEVRCVDGPGFAPLGHVAHPGRRP
jgi:hypothetical protein